MIHVDRAVDEVIRRKLAPQPLFKTADTQHAVVITIGREPDFLGNDVVFVNQAGINAATKTQKPPSQCSLRKSRFFDLVRTMANGKLRKQIQLRDLIVVVIGAAIAVVVAIIWWYWRAKRPSSQTDRV